MNKDKDVYVIVYNPLGVRQSTIVHLPVSTDGTYTVSKIGESPDQVFVVSSSPSLIAVAENSADHIVHFDTGTLPHIGASVFQVSLKEARTYRSVDTSLFTKSEHRLLTSKGDVKVKNDIFSATFDG